MVIKDAVQQYKNTQVASATSEETVLMLYDGVIKFLRKAILYMGTNNKKKLVFIQKALKIIDYLQSSLDMQKGGEVARNLNDLYEYMLVQIVKANLKNDGNKINEIIRILEPVRDAWADICKNSKAAQNSTISGNNPSYGVSQGYAENRKVAVSA